MIFRLMVKVMVRNNSRENELNVVCIVQVVSGSVNADVNGAANILKKAFIRLTKETSFNIETVNVWNPQTKII